MTIKETAGKVVLYFYQLQRTAPLTMSNRQVGFVDRKEKSMGLTSDKKWLAKDLLGINPVASDVLNAFVFLINKGFIQPRERVATDARIYVGVQLTDKGIDIVEGIERGRDGKRDFELVFNIKVENSLDVDGLIKDKLSMLSN